VYPVFDEGEDIAGGAASMNADQQEPSIKQMLREWIGERAHRPVNDGLRDDTPILEQRVITSLQVMELILFVEKASGHSVNISQLKPCSFRSIDHIYNSFFAGASHEQLTV
jgi:hypothetical protein